MITALVLYALAVGVLVAPAALVLDRAALAARTPRRTIWFGALALLVTLTALAPWRLARTSPAVAVAVPMVATADVTAPSAAGETPRWPSRALDAVRSSVARGIGSVASRVPPGIDRAIGAAWAVAALTGLTLLALVLRRLDRMRRHWPTARLLDTTVRIGEDDGPAVYGLVAPDIVVPRALLTRDAHAQSIVLAHEDEHRKARDPLLLAVAAALVALLPWHPVAWWCLSRLRLATELDCDARVLRRGVSARRYGDVLLSLASALPATPRATHALALVDSRRHLERRLLAMTTPRTRRSPVVLGGLVLTGVVLVAAACTTDVPTAAEVRDADVATVTRTLGLPADGRTVVYYVDGERRSAAAAQGVSADEIASIDVRRAVGAQATDEVRIVTRTAASTALADAKDRALVQEPVRSATASGVATDTADGAPRLVLRSDPIAFASALRGLSDTASAARAEPLVIVDGIVATVRRPLENLLPAQIASVEVLKGDVARRIYGARATNGVIVITTNK